MAKRIKVGDIVEIKTSKGYAYAQYVMKDKQWGALLRVKEPIFSEPQTEFEGIVSGDERFITFYPLQASINQGIFRIAGNLEVPYDRGEVSVWRAVGFRDRKGKILDWWIVKGEQETPTKRLSRAQKKLPIQEVINDTELIRRIEQNWKAEDEV